MTRRKYPTANSEQAEHLLDILDYVKARCIEAIIFSEFIQEPIDRYFLIFEKMEGLKPLTIDGKCIFKEEFP
jgi:hypothetical protein